MIVELEIEGKKITVDGRFQYTKQASDVGDASTSNANFTNSFSLKNDSETTRALKGLSIAGSRSNVPYSKVSNSIFIDQIQVANNGWLHVRESDKDKFKANFIDGNVDFWKAIDGVSLADIDLHEANHEKNFESITNSFDNPYYKYIIGEYGGRIYYRPNEDVTVVWIDQQVPSINEKFVMDRIFKHLGMTYNMSPEIDTWLTYPKDTVKDSGILETLKFGIEDDTYQNTGRDDDFLRFKPNNIIDVDNQGSIILNQSNITLEIQDKAFYLFDHDWVKNRAEYILINPRTGRREYASLPVNIYLLVNGSKKNIPTELELREGDVVEIVFEAMNDSDIEAMGYVGVDGSVGGYRVWEVNNLELEGYEFEVRYREYSSIDFGNSLEDISARDFVKYMMMRFGMTLFYEDGHVEFMTIQERLDAESVDYSDFYKERKKESYVYSNYAHRNRLKHKYKHDTQDFNDGILYSNNLNLEKEKTIFESFVFSPSKDGSMEVFEKDIQKDGDRVVINHKSIEGRMYSIRYTMEDVGWILIMRSNVMNDTDDYAGLVPVPDTSKTTFRYYTQKYWKPFERLIQRAKVLTIIMDMSIVHFLQIDLKKKVYLSQEKAYFLINKAVIKGDREVELELIKID